MLDGKLLSLGLSGTMLPPEVQADPLPHLRALRSMLNTREKSFRARILVLGTLLIEGGFDGDCHF